MQILHTIREMTQRADPRTLFNPVWWTFVGGGNTSQLSEPDGHFAFCKDCVVEVELPSQLSIHNRSTRDLQKFTSTWVIC